MERAAVTLVTTPEVIFDEYIKLVVSVVIMTILIAVLVNAVRPNIRKKKRKKLVIIISN